MGVLSLFWQCWFHSTWEAPHTASALVWVVELPLVTAVVSIETIGLWESNQGLAQTSVQG